MNGLTVAGEGVFLVMISIGTYHLSTWLERWDYKRHRED